MSGHTPGPVTLSRGAQADPFAIESASRTLAHVKQVGMDTEANAERLVACWNACEGIADPSAVGDLLALVKRALHESARVRPGFAAEIREIISRAEGES